MNQKPSVVQILKSVSKVLTSDSVTRFVTGAKGKKPGPNEDLIQQVDGRLKAIIIDRNGKTYSSDTLPENAVM